MKFCFIYRPENSGSKNSGSRIFGISVRVYETSYGCNNKNVENMDEGVSQGYNLNKALLRASLSASAGRIRFGSPEF
jgi:hypothetical protein